MAIMVDNGPWEQFAKTVWEDNQTDIKKIINNIRFSYKLDSDFHLEAEIIFYDRFVKYYESSQQYLSFFYTCLTNKAKNIYRKRVAESKLVTIVRMQDGTEVNALDIACQSCYNNMSFLDELHLNQVYEELEESLGWDAFFTFKNLVDGVTKKDIKEALGINEAELKELESMIKDELKMFFEYDDTKYIKGPWEIDGKVYDYKLIDDDGEDYCTAEQVAMWTKQRSFSWVS